MLEGSGEQVLDVRERTEFGMPTGDREVLSGYEGYEVVPGELEEAGWGRVGVLDYEEGLMGFGWRGLVRV